MKSLLSTHDRNATSERIASILDELPAVLWEASGEPGTPSFRMDYVSEFAQRLLGYPTERWLNEPNFWSEIVHSDDREPVLKLMQAVYDGVSNGSKEFRWQSADGRVLWAEAQTTVLRDASDQPSGLRGVLLDITARKSAEAKSLESEARFRSVFESDLLPVFQRYRDGRVTDANDPYLALVGYNRQELREGKINWLEMTPSEYIELDQNAMDELARKNKCTPYEKEYRIRDGQKVPVLVGLVPLPDEPDCALGYVLDMSHLRQAQAASLEAKGLQTAVLRSLKEQVAIIDRVGVILEVNDAWRSQGLQGGLEPDFRWEGRNYLEARSSDGANSVRLARSTHEGILAVLNGEKNLHQEEYRCLTPVRTLWFEMTVVPLKRCEGGAVVVHSDITARKEAEIETRAMREQLAHATRINSLSELSGALAHELNQPLTAILASAQAAERYLGRGTDVTRELQELLPAIVAQSVRGGEIIHRVLSMSRKQTAEFKCVSINEVLTEMLRLLNSDLITKNISLQINLTDELPKVRGDRVQLQQLVVNLIVNGCEAMEANEASERVLTVRSFAPDRGHIAFSISDSGTGIDDGMLAHVFNPFVTSKCGGLGLGLSICHTIVDAHGGDIHIRNDSQRGATAEVRLASV